MPSRIGAAFSAVLSRTRIDRAEFTQRSFDDENFRSLYPRLKYGRCSRSRRVSPISWMSRHSMTSESLKLSAGGVAPLKKDGRESRVRTIFVSISKMNEYEGGLLAVW